MNSNFGRYLKLWYQLIILLLFVFCENHIIERSTGDYFPTEEGNWWFYSNSDLYQPKTLEVSVEPKDTLLEIECYPFNYSGDFHYFAIDQNGVKEYIKIVQNYGGNDYIILEGFIRRLELPLVRGNLFIDSLVDSLDFFGEWIKGSYKIEGYVSDYIVDKLYGTIYKVIRTTVQTIRTADSAFTKEEYLEEYYAPNIGLIRFKTGEDEFKLTDYKLN
ncbi:MAG: hypothetical protein ABIL70_04355 [candidate division WOR-3 bacterium]